MEFNLADLFENAVDHFGDDLLLLAHYYMGGEIVKLVERYGGVVADSDPHAEWRESLDKAEPLLAALEDQAGSRTREKKSPNPVVRAGEAS